MEIIETTFQSLDSNKEEEQFEAIDLLIGAYRMNGQVLGREYTIHKNNDSYYSYLKTPEKNSLNDQFNNEYVIRNIAKCKDANLRGPLHNYLGHDLDSGKLCTCDKSSALILYTNLWSLEPPLRCMDCFGVFPLYKIPKTYDEEYYDVICWQSDYQSCDSLQMNCKVGERFSMRQMLELDSALTKQGREVCNNISNKTKLDVYYYLYKGKGRSNKDEKSRVCPSCGQEWLLEQPLFDLFDFKCANCKLVSNISWDVRS